MTKEEKEVLYQCYLESGLSPKEFAEKNNINPAVIRGLVSFHKRIDASEQSSFITITTKEKDNCQSKRSHISFKLDGHHIEIDQSLLSLFLGALHD